MNIDELTTAFTALHIPKSHVTVGLANLIASHKELRTLLQHRRLPNYGWSDVQIQSVLLLFATLDTNNKSVTQSTTIIDPQSNDDDNSQKSIRDNVRWCGVGEREGRCYSQLVSNRHFGLTHGMGRSGDLNEAQPKAVGSSLLVRLTTHLVLDAMRKVNKLHPQMTAAHGLVLPLCTGMSLSMVLSSLRDLQKSTNNKNIVLWSRIDQKSCYKSILTAGLECVVVPTCIDGDAVVTDLAAMQAALQKHGSNVLAVVTTTSCFAPRVPDKIDKVAKLCKEHEVNHIINNAYGLQSTSICKLINRACVVGRVDAIVCSTDKNFLVPVGGAIVISPNIKVIQAVSKVYAGRASSAPLVDLFITLLSMGLSGYQQVLDRRNNMLENFQTRLSQVAKSHGERLLTCAGNDISFGITLDTLSKIERQETETGEESLQKCLKEVTSFGSMLFRRCVSGTRVIPKGDSKSMGDTHVFKGFGSSTEDYPHHYMTAACAIGLSQAEVDEFFVRLDKTFREYKKKKK